jgi:hypothetical protein
MVERQLPKLHTRVRFPSPAPVIGTRTGWPVHAKRGPNWSNSGDVLYQSMTKTLMDLLEHAATWPREDQDELAEYAREIEARRTGNYTMSDDERISVNEGLAEADRGEFVSDELVAEADKRHGRSHPRDGHI